MDPVTAFGVVAGIVQLGSFVADLAGNLRRSRHQGGQLIRLRDILQELSQLRLQIAKDDPDVERVVRLVGKCRALLEEHDPKLRGSRGLTFAWPASLENEIRIINEDLTRMYTRLLLHRVDLPPTPSSLGSQQGQPSRTPSLPPYALLPEPALTTPALSRRGSLEFIDLPATLALGEDGPRLTLQHVNILERDSSSRILQYESGDRQVVVTHRIPFGTKPNADGDVRARRVNFLAQHEVTVEDRDGFRVYCVDPTYVFGSSANCASFISKVRERELVATFLPREVRRGAETRARAKVLRVWRKLGQGVLGAGAAAAPTRSLVTLGFHDRVEGRQTEVDVRLYDHAVVVQTRDRKVLDIWRTDGSSKLSLTFENAKDAKSFQDVYEDVHPDKPSASPAYPPSLPPLNF
ncbi:hypothetical protein KVR01_011525 [Diaporthe batatas]|uniref:uncharacterized protein n=1 Tax=Diaporthe batatas TaxID=748121 RepID=UPI001D058073|nr:uncharacterized protein KVR01_011525 [Diaporthe batatas]KAG8158403.1 hypothetical protein KVR01_011525 [Diaporthe batatas]